MKKRLSEIIYSITGIDTPFLGISWNPPVNEVEIAQRFITFIENKRVLFNIYEKESGKAVIESVNDIRQEIGNVLKSLKRSSKLANYFVELQRFCREFLDTVDTIEVNKIEGLDSGWTSVMFRLYAEGFFSALGTFREKFWKHVSEIIEIYNLEISEYLKPFLTDYAIGNVSIKGSLIVFTHRKQGLEPTLLLLQGKPWEKIWVLKCPSHLLRSLYSYDNQEIIIQGVAVQDGEHIEVQSVNLPKESNLPYQKVERILAQREKLINEIGKLS